MELETERLRLRLLTSADEEAVYSLPSDDRILGAPPASPGGADPGRRGGDARSGRELRWEGRRPWTRLAEPCHATQLTRGV